MFQICIFHGFCSILHSSEVFISVLRNFSTFSIFPHNFANFFLFLRSLLFFSLDSYVISRFYYILSCNFAKLFNFYIIWLILVQFYFFRKVYSFLKFFCGFYFSVILFCGFCFNFIHFAVSYSRCTLSLCFLVVSSNLFFFLLANFKVFALFLFDTIECT